MCSSDPYSYARLVPRLTYGLYRIMWLGGCSFSGFSEHGSASEGLFERVIEMIIEEVLWLSVG